MISFLGIISGLICVFSALIWIVLLFSKDIKRRKNVGIIFWIFAVLFVFCGLITPASYRKSATKSTQVSDSKKEIYSVEIKDIKVDEDGYLLVTGRTDAPNGALVLAQSVTDNDINQASSEDGNLVKVKNSKFKIYLNTVCLYDTTKLKVGQKLKIKVFATIGYKIKENEFSVKLKKALKKATIEPVIFKATKELCKKVNDDSDDDSKSLEAKKERTDSNTEDDTSEKEDDDELDDVDEENDNLDDEDTDDELSDENEELNDDTEEDTDDELDDSVSDEEESNDDAFDGKVIAGDSNEIIGDSVTGKYHMPGQARYYINEDRAVYFKSEKDAQDQGYIKSKR